MAGVSFYEKGNMGNVVFGEGQVQEYSFSMLNVRNWRDGGNNWDTSSKGLKPIGDLDWKYWFMRHQQVNVNQDRRTAAILLMRMG